MAEKNIKEVDTTEADFVANAADGNDAFLTDDAGHPMVKKRGTNTDFFYPTKVRDAGGNYTYPAQRMGTPLDLGNGFTLVTTADTCEIYIDGAPAGIVLASR
jgi:hypothetical protein